MTAARPEASGREEGSMFTHTMHWFDDTLYETDTYNSLKLH